MRPSYEERSRRATRNDCESQESVGYPATWRTMQVLLLMSGPGWAGVWNLVFFG